MTGLGSASFMRACASGSGDSRPNPDSAPLSGSGSLGNGGIPQAVRLVLAIMLALVAMLGMTTRAEAETASAHAQVPMVWSAQQWLPLSALCHASGPTPAHDAVMPSHFECSGEPHDFQHGSLWLRARAGAVGSLDETPVLMVHSSRFDRLLVGFGYADGTTEWQDVRSGDYGARWRLGGQIAFVPTQREVPLTGITMRFDRLGSAEMLRMRLVDRGQSELQATAMASMIGAALMLLAVGALYNLGLAIAVRRMFPAWQGAWAAAMVVWGAMWSQFHLFFVPGLAGAVSAQICTGLSCMAIFFATLSLTTSIEPGLVPRWLLRTTSGTALVCGLLGIPLGMMRSGPMEFLATWLGFIVLGLLIEIIACLVIAMRRGSRAARSFLGAWLFPILVMFLSGFYNTDQWFWGGGAQMLVLVSASWQTVWLSVAATRGFTRMRIERDRALAAQAAAQEQARRDPLTGLRNRRGFIDSIAPVMKRLAHAPAHAPAPVDARHGHSQRNAEGATGADEDAVALMVLDVDRFKGINDTFGHEAGDAVLVTLARRLERWDEGMCVVARLGGRGIRRAGQWHGSFCRAATGRERAGRDRGLRSSCRPWRAHGDGQHRGGHGPAGRRFRHALPHCGCRALCCQASGTQPGGHGPRDRQPPSPGNGRPATLGGYRISPFCRCIRACYAGHLGAPMTRAIGLRVRQGG